MNEFLSVAYKCLLVTLMLRSVTGSYKHHSINSTRSEFVYRSFQETIYCSPSTSIKFPKNVQEVQEIVNSANKYNETVKAIGNRHSVTDIICTDGIPISLKNINYTIDHQDGTATFGAGLDLMDAMLFLEDRGKTLIHIPIYGGITIGGAIGTGAHGTTLLHPSSISDQVVGLTVVDGTGHIRKITSSHDLKAFRVHLGLLGIVIDVTLSTVPVFKMTVTNEVQPESVIFDGKILEWAKAFDSFKFFWFPSIAGVVVSKGMYLTDINTPGNASANDNPNWTSEKLIVAKQTAETLHFLRATDVLLSTQPIDELAVHSTVAGKRALYTEDGVNDLNPATGFAWRMLTSICQKCPWDNGNQSLLGIDSGISIATSELPAAIQTIKRILKENPAPFSSTGILVRFSQASDVLMETSSGRETAHIEWSSFVRDDPFQTAKVGLASYQAIWQALINKHGGRPHYGKAGVHYLTEQVFKTSTPNRHKFIKAMKKFDPNGIFLNKFGRRLLGTSDKMDIDPRVTHCAIQDYCICAKDDDCAPLQTCSSIFGYSVCKDSWEPPSVDVIQSVVQALPA